MNCKTAGAVTMTLLLMITGCSLRSTSLSQSRMDIPPAYAEKEGHAREQGMWWKKFDDERLNAVMEQAFRENLDLKQAFERFKQFEATARKTDSSRKLSLSLDGTAGRGRQPGIPGPSTEDTYQFSAAASFELDLWRKLDARSRAARFESLAARDDVRTLFLTLSAEIADLYFLAVEQKAQLVLSEESITSFADTLERVERRYLGGVVPALDVYQSRQNLATARAQRPLFASTLATTVHALSVLTGEFPEGATEDIPHTLPDPPEFPEGVPSQLLLNRPDIKAALLRLRSSDAEVAAAIADRFPSLQITAAYGGTGSTTSSILDSPNIFWNLLLQIAQPVLDGGRRRAEVDRTEALFRENLAAYHEAVLTAFREVKDSLAVIESSRERIIRLRESVASSESAHRLALDRYLQGLTDFLPVLTEQVRLFTARSNLIAERRKLISGHIQLARALGGEWVNDAFDNYVVSQQGMERRK